MIYHAIRILALLGVLLHAGALARHHAIMVDAQVQHRQLAADLALLCTAGGDIDAQDLPGLPQPTDQSSCLFCLGAAQFAFSAPEIGFVLLVLQPIVFEPVSGAVAAVTVTTRTPPARAPPFAA